MVEPIKKVEEIIENINTNVVFHNKIHELIVIYLT